MDFSQVFAIIGWYLSIRIVPKLSFTRELLKLNRDLLARCQTLMSNRAQDLSLNGSDSSLCLDGKQLRNPLSPGLSSVIEEDRI